jgi:hypothetical protein
MEAEAVPKVRNFNRTVTEAIGALDNRFLGPPRPLSEAGLLWEIGSVWADIRSLAHPGTSEREATRDPGRGDDRSRAPGTGIHGAHPD